VTDTLRHTILDALVTKLSAITVASGYRHTVTTVEVAARGFDEEAARSLKRPHIGIIPQEETFTDHCGQCVSDWRMDLVAHVDCTRTTIGNAEACTNITNDIRYALYEDVSLGVTGVIGCWMVSRIGSEGSPQAAQDGIATVIITIIVRFEEAMTMH